MHTDLTRFWTTLYGGSVYQDWSDTSAFISHSIRQGVINNGWCYRRVEDRVCYTSFVLDDICITFLRWCRARPALSSSRRWPLPSSSTLRLLWVRGIRCGTCLLYRSYFDSSFQHLERQLERRPTTPCEIVTVVAISSSVEHKINSSVISRYSIGNIDAIIICL